MSRNVTVSIYDGDHRVAKFEDVEVLPSSDPEPTPEVQLPEPWGELVNWDTEYWDEYHVTYEVREEVKRCTVAAWDEVKR